MAMVQKSFEEQSKVNSICQSQIDYNLLVVQITKRDVAVQCNYLVPISGCYG